VAAPRASWSMITLRLVCAVAKDAEASATTAVMNRKILFRPMAMLDPLVVIRLMIICGSFHLVAFRRQDTCGTNGAYSSPPRVSQGKTASFAAERAAQKPAASIADVIIRGCFRAA